MNNKGKNKNKNKKGKGAQGQKKAADSDGSWEEMLNAPLPENEESTADMTHESTPAATKGGAQAAGDDGEWEDDDTTVTTTNTGSTKAKAGNRQSASKGEAADEEGEGDEEGDRNGKKKRKKRANKRTVAKLKEMRKDFMERCVSPIYHSVNCLQLNGEVKLFNLKNFNFEAEEDAIYKNTRSKKGKGKKGKAGPPPPTMNQQQMPYPGMEMGMGAPGMMIPPPIDPTVAMMPQGNDWMHPGMLGYDQQPGEFYMPAPIYNNPDEMANAAQPQQKPDSDYNDEGGNSSEEEHLYDYHIEGYHPCHVNEIIDNRYVILRKLGWGHFSTVWLALKLQDKKLYALKIQKSANKYTESALEEEEILYNVASNYQNRDWEQSVRKYLSDPTLEVNRLHTHNLQMYDQFFHHASHGRHSVMAFEVLGRNLLTLIKRFNYNGIPIPIVREIAKQTLMGLDYLHRICGIIHTDLKPENVVFEIEETAKLELLEEEVLNTPLVELYDHTEPIVLNKKQAQNLKKKQRKKAKQQAAKVANAGGEEESKGEPAAADDDANEETAADAEEEKKEASDVKEDRKSKAAAIKKLMRAKIKVEEDEFKANHIFPIERRTKSCFQLHGKYQNTSILGEPDMADAHIWYSHPTNQYKNWVRKNAANDFQELKDQADGDALKYKYLRKIACKKLHRKMRVSSHNHAYKAAKMFMELKPKNMQDLNEICDLMFNLKIVDMGNACYVDKHYSDVIQTREYRSPEVILDGEYDATADIWSLACMVFELATGDYLFDPKKGKTYKKNDDHLAQVSETIGECRDVPFLRSCEAAADFYDKKGNLKRIKKLKPWGIKEILVEKYRIKPTEALFLARFLQRCLKWNPKDRASAKDLLDDPWIKMQPKYDARMDPQLYNEYMFAVDKNYQPSEKSSSSSQDRDNTGSQNDGEWTASEGARSSQESGDFKLNRSLSKSSGE